MKANLIREIAMRRLSLLLIAFLPLAALAQQGPTLYPYNKNQLPPGAVYDNNPGIPTSGTEQARQLDANNPQRQRSGPTVIQRNYDRKGSTTVINGPNGTTVCTDAYGRRSSTTVCY